MSFPRVDGDQLEGGDGTAGEGCEAETAMHSTCRRACWRKEKRAPVPLGAVQALGCGYSPLHDSVLVLPQISVTRRQGAGAAVADEAGVSAWAAGKEQGQPYSRLLWWGARL